MGPGFRARGLLLAEKNGYDVGAFVDQLDIWI